jgi:hypothetical protein
MASSREQYADILDSLLNAGSNGEPLHPGHVPHLSGRKMLIVLPAVLVQDCYHLAEIDFTDLSIHYKQTLSRDESPGRDRQWFRAEADDYLSSQWGSSLGRFEQHYIRQTRDLRNKCTWRVVKEGVKDIIMQTEHRSEFMELARQCDVVYDD